MSTPGAIMLIFQAILPFIIFSGRWSEPVQVTVQGGTNVSFSPSYDYVKQVLLPTLARIGVPPITSRLNSRGWSHGRTEVGSVTFTITPLSSGCALQQFELRDRGDISKITATVLAPGMCSSACRSYLYYYEHHKLIYDTVRHQIEQYFHKKGLDVPIDVKFQDSLHQKRIYLLLVAEFTSGHLLGRDFLYDRKITSPLNVVADVIKRVANELLDEISTGKCVDEYMQDQLVIFQALAKGRSVVDGREGADASLHTKTARWIVDQLLGVKFSEAGSCEGIGFVAGKGFDADADKSIENNVTEDLNALQT